ncbi:PREDICTED: acyl-CoA-binding domain-containing protein 6 [Ceratosolen solmsi marchali]|uniref:Acyl-CoA-binding domain-containing protein 6 n=1 Tax=Ceratosolen solmsi marchali TaxID=326594 RepID=A0AAJ6YXJ7_9HYME|nr:PREDICTED: acyl-CoA-binding domain-containing protein 6 [Ceratosolen solmsi marchali]
MANLNYETLELQQVFNNAAAHLQSLAPQLSATQLLMFYSLYKQATCGPCYISMPSVYQIQAKRKWEAWKSLGNMSKEIAMECYINNLGKLDPTWEKDACSKIQGWAMVSKMLSTDIELNDTDKTLLDWVKDCNEEQVQIYLSHNKQDIHLKDENGMLPIHWAADRGNLQILKYLIEAGSDVNVADEDGQTPLHYAASCGHKEIVKYFLSLNVDLIKDNCGMLPKDVADQTLSTMF